MTARPALSEGQLIRLKDLFEEAIDTDPRYVDEFVITSTSGDPVLRSELQSLLGAHSQSSDYFDRLAEEVVGGALTALEPPNDDELPVPGKTIRHYELLEQIGTGGMGVVFKARDSRLGRTVALKFLPPRYASSPTARARLLAEARAASALDHPNIGVVHEIGESDDGRPFIAMAWYDGETLKSRMRAERMSSTEAATIGEQLASALAAAHSAGVIHRDVKPANVIITRSGVVKLVDFGIAKLQSVEDGESRSRAGTIPYMSPEQTAGKPLDLRTDIWSMGVLLYEIIAGQRPFRGTTDAEVIRAIQNEEPPVPARMRSELDASLVAIVERCLAKDPSARYQTAGELSGALRDWNMGLRTNGVPGPRHRQRFALAAAAIVAIIGGVLAYREVTTSDTASGFDAPRLSIAVLPFVHSSLPDSLAYLGTGLSEELRAELSRVATFVVPTFEGSRTYQGSAKPLPAISSELSADFLVTGSVWHGPAGGEVRISLVDGKSGEPAWTRAFRLTPELLPRIAREAAKELFSNVGAKPDELNRRRLDEPATPSSLAYDLYLKGLSAELLAAPKIVRGVVSRDSLRRAQALYAQAKSLDPAFAAARARLAATHMATAAATDTSVTRREQARVEAEVALRVDSLLPDAHDALATYWARSGNRDKQIETLERARRLSPNNARLTALLASAYVAVGRWEDGVEMYDRATTLDPRNPKVLFSAAATFGRLRRQERGMIAFKRILEISPDDHEMRLVRGQSWLRWKGTADTLLAAANYVPEEWDERGMTTFAWYTALLSQRRFRDVLDMLDKSRSQLSTDGLVYHPKELMRAEAYHGLGDEARARHHYDLARDFLEKKSAADPTNAAIHSALGLAYAGLGRKKEAMREAERAMKIVPLTSTAYRGTAYMGLAVEIFARVDDLDRAFEMIDLMLTMPSGREITIPYLRVWPGFDPLRSDPRFDDVIRRYAALYPTGPG